MMLQQDKRGKKKKKVGGGERGWWYFFFFLYMISNISTSSVQNWGCCEFYFAMIKRGGDHSKSL